MPNDESSTRAPDVDGAGDKARLQPLAQLPDPRIGTVLVDRYAIDHLLGTTAMGAVYAARDLEQNQGVAVKLLDRTQIHDPHSEERFLQDAEVLAGLNDPHVVSVLGHGRNESGEPFLVMELLQGATLRDVITLADGAGAVPTALDLERVRDRIGSSPFREDRFLRLAVRWCAEIAAGLVAVHDHGVSHRDVQPAKIFLGRDGNAVLLDFGVATRAGADSITLALSTLGTPRYMSPEQAHGEALSGPALDVYGLCATLYHVLSGRPPYPGDPAQVLAAMLLGNSRPLSEIDSSLPCELVAIVEHGMEREATRRYRTAAELEADLRAFLDHRPVIVRPITRLGRWRRRIALAPGRWYGAGLAAALAAVVVVGVPVRLLADARSRAAEALELSRRLAPLLALEGSPTQRRQIDGAEHAGNIVILDRILALDAQDVPARLLRAALRQDLGQHTAAAADLETLAAQTSSDYLRTVAACYGRAAAQQKGFGAVDFEALTPKPNAPVDFYVAGFHALRNGTDPRYARSADNLLRAATADYVPARDLRLIALLSSAADDAAERRQEIFGEVLDEVDSLEAIYGLATARTCAARGMALIGLERYREALAPLRRSLEMQPESHDALHGLAVAYRELGDREAAAEHFGQAHHLRPYADGTRVALARVLFEQRHYEQAYDLAEQLPTEGFELQRPQLLGSIALFRLLDLFGQLASADQMAAWADRARKHAKEGLDALPKNGRNPAWVRRFTGLAAAAAALLERDADRAVVPVMHFLIGQRPSGMEVLEVASLLRSVELGRDAVVPLRMLLAQIAMSIDPRDARLVQAATKMLAKILKDN